MFDRIDGFIHDVSAIESEPDLKSVLAELSEEMGFSFFALSHHVDPRHGSPTGIRLHNYPVDWEDYYDGQKLGRCDPVHRASRVTTVGFPWSRLPRMIQLTTRDCEILERARKRGIGDGFTVPAHVPGEPTGSCTFATCSGRSIDEEHLSLAQLVGPFAFEAARRLARMGKLEPSGTPRLTDRQHDCLVWAARGKSDWEIARILGISPETAHQYVKQARAAYHVVSRTQLVVHALFDGTISFGEIMKR